MLTIIEAIELIFCAWFVLSHLLHKQPRTLTFNAFLAASVALSLDLAFFDGHKPLELTLLLNVPCAVLIYEKLFRNAVILVVHKIVAALRSPVVGPE